MHSIFVVGCPRSGTTLLQTLLATQAGLTTFTESHFFEMQMHPRRLAGRTIVVPNGVFRGLVTPFIEENGFSVDDSFVAEWPGERVTRRFLGRIYSRRFLRLLDVLAARRAASGWVEKTPGHLHAIDYIRRIRPSVAFVHTVREGRATVASMFRASPIWGDPKTMTECARRWRDDLITSARYAGQPGHTHVVYEDLVASPADSIRGICASLGLPFDESLLKDAGAVAQMAVRPSETWKLRNLAAIGEAPTSDDSAGSPVVDEEVGRLIDDTTVRQAMERVREAGVAHAA